MTCCNSGKAIVKFNPYKKGQFKYRLMSSSPWQEINAEEDLIGICEDTVSYIPGQQIVFYFKVKINGVVQENIYYEGFYSQWVTPVSYIFIREGERNSEINVTGKESSGIETTTGSIWPYATFIPIGWGPHPNLTPVYKVKFTVKGAETGAEYLTLTNLDQCPEVQKEGCQLQPEQSLQVELIQFNASWLKKIFPAVPLPTVLTECVIVESAVPLAGPECVVIKKRLGVPYNIFEVIQGVVGLPFESVVKVLCSDPNCPPPQVTVVCQEEEKDDECPPETDCEIVCKGFKCCYSKGKVIKVIPV